MVRRATVQPLEEKQRDSALPTTGNLRRRLSRGRRSKHRDVLSQQCSVQAEAFGDAG